MPYDSILNWIVFKDPTVNPFYTAYNLPYDIGFKLWEILGGAIAWLLNLIFPGNGASKWLVSQEVTASLAVVLMVVVIFAVAFIINLTMIWIERKVLGRMMDRRATQIGPLGYLQCLGDGLKTFLKENITPSKVDKKGYMWALSLVIGTSVLIACMIPLSDRWFIVDYNTGFLIIFGLFAIAPFMILVAGWAQNNKYALLGGMRAAAQMISYEVPMLIIFASVALMAGSFNINDIVHCMFHRFFLRNQCFVNFCKWQKLCPVFCRTVRFCVKPQIWHTTIKQRNYRSFKRSFHYYSFISSNRFNSFEIVIGETNVCGVNSKYSFVNLRLDSSINRYPTLCSNGVRALICRRYNQIFLFNANNRPFHRNDIEKVIHFCFSKWWNFPAFCSILDSFAYICTDFILSHIHSKAIAHTRKIFLHRKFSLSEHFIQNVLFNLI